MSNRPTDDALEWLKKREGYEPQVYEDSVGNPTAGYGHLLSPDEQQSMPVGTQVDDMKADVWLAEQSNASWEAAQRQAEAIGKPELTEALFHVNYQLGPNWPKIHTKTWEKLKEGDLEAVAQEVEQSKWHQQTPKRTKDFQQSLRGLPREEEYGA